MIRSRVLPYAEWEKVQSRPPYTESGMPAADGHWQIVVVEEVPSEEILASCAIFDTVHWDGFHVNADAQKNPSVFRALLEESLTALRDAGVPGAHITIPDSEPGLLAMAKSFGFIEAPGKLLIYQVPL